MERSSRESGLLDGSENSNDTEENGQPEYGGGDSKVAFGGWLQLIVLANEGPEWPVTRTWVEHSHAAKVLMMQSGGENTSA